MLRQRSAQWIVQDWVMAARTSSNISIERRIIVVRGQRALLDTDLATLYGVPVKVLNQAVRRNFERFPDDFMFQLTWAEVAASRSQIVTLNDAVTRGRGTNPKYRSYAFTEQGVAMLSSVLRSSKAVAVNIAIMRAFVRLREIARGSAELAKKLDELERRVSGHDEAIADIVRAIRELAAPPEDQARRRIGF
jgi:ORF6N domain